MVNYQQNNGVSPKKVGLLAGALVALVTLGFCAPQLIETNDSGHYHVKQAAVSGEMSVIRTPGTYIQGMGKITDYKISEDIVFGKDSEGNIKDLPPIKVTFGDSATALVSGNLRFKLSTVEKDALSLHETYRSFEALRETAIPKLLAEALGQTAPLMKAEESYSSRRAEFTKLAEQQLQRGVFEKTFRELQRKNTEGTEFVERLTELSLDENKRPIVSKASPFDVFNIEVVQFTVTDFDYDEKTDELINARKETEQLRVTARAQAETAKQNAITEEEKGKALVAKERAAKEVEKIAAVTTAEKEFEVARLGRLKAKEEAEKNLTLSRAEAEGNRLKVAAGLTPLERANIERDTAIGVAEQLAKVKFPELMVISGGEGKNGNGLNPFDAVGLKALRDLSREMTTSK
jgi:regulator of protease activity HflC (stomatin/prohibitin superfamily)